uniref:Peptidase A1 domain-containing protein n=1 Tax=Caenorhabditis tropicalis TaxID=1561998 RepID=A0A1I7TI58_9PELO
MPHSEVLQTEEKTAVYEVPGDKIDGGLICKKATFELDQGLSSSANFALLDVSNRDYECSRRVAIGNIGANLNVSRVDGIELGVDADVLRAIYEGENFKIGTGLSYSTGVKYQPDSWKLHFMGYGFEYDTEGFGIRIPILELKYKWW